MNYLFHIIIMINIYIILTVSTNLMVGMANLVSLGQGAFYGIGAYMAVLSLMILDLPLIPALILVMIATALMSLIIAIPSLKLKDEYFILATLGFQLIVYTILYNWISVTRGPYGIPGIPAPKLFGAIPISGIMPFLILSTILAVGVIFLFKLLIYSPFGGTLKGIRNDEIAVESLGRNVRYFKVLAFFITTMFTSIAGFIYATYVSYIDPTSFNLDEAIFILSAVIIGGTGNIKGPVVGAIFVVVLPEILCFVGFPDSVAANLRQIVYGLSIVLLMRFRPSGLAGEYTLS